MKCGDERDIEARATRRATLARARRERRSMVVSNDARAREEDVVARARRENRDTATALVTIWKSRCEALTRDLEHAHGTYEEIKRELFRAREDAREAAAVREEMENELTRTRRLSELNSNANASAEAEIRSLRRAVEEGNRERDALDVECRAFRGELAANAENAEIERAAARGALDGERRKRESAEKRASKMERAVKAMRDEYEAKERQFLNELERERAVRARLEEERVELEADRRRFRDFESMLAAERVKVVEAHSAGKIAQDTLREQLTKSENETMALRRMMETRSTEMANAVRQLNEELAAQHEIVERGMASRVDALRETFDDELARARERANEMIESARKSVKEANERVARMESTATRAENVSRNALMKLKEIAAASADTERECAQLRTNLHAVGEINAKLTRRIIDGEPFVLDEELDVVREPGAEMSVNTPSPASERSRGKPAKFDTRDIQHIHRELQNELSKLRVEHESIAREIGGSSGAEGEFLAKALEDAQERVESKARQVKLLNKTIRSATH